MKLERALLCVEMDCQEVFAADGDCRCPACGNSIAFPVAQLLNGPTILPTVRQTVGQAPHYTLVLPERALASPVLVFDRARRLSRRASQVRSSREAAELTDFRQYLEERMPSLEQVPSSEQHSSRISQAG